MVVFAALSLPAWSALSWTEGFENDTGVNQPLNTTTWLNYFGNSGTLGPIDSADTSLVVGPAAGAPITVGGFGGNGYHYDSNNVGVSPAGVRNLTITESGPDITVAQLETVTFFARMNAALSADPDHGVALVVQVDGSWYRTPDVYGSATSGVWDGHTITQAELTAGPLDQVLFTEDVILDGRPGQGTPRTLAGGDLITGIGFYGYQQTAFRVDDLTVSYVPEPSVAWLAALGLFGIGRRRR